MDEWFYFNLVGGKKKKLCDWFLQNILHSCLVLKHIVYVSFYILTSACNFGTHCCVCLFDQEIENEKLKLEHVQLSEENSGLRVQNQKLAEEASYAKELASAAAVELKNLAGEVTKLSLQNAKLEKELLSARELAHSRSTAMQTVNGVNRKYNDGTKLGRKGRLSGRANEISGLVCDDFESWNLDPDDLKMELQARKQREAALEAALAEKEFVEDEYRKKADEAKKREEALENDLANMWVLVAKLKKEGGTIPELNTDERHGDGTDYISDPKTNEIESNTVLQDRTVLDISKPADEIPKEEPLVVRLKVNCILHVAANMIVPNFLISLNFELEKPMFDSIISLSRPRVGQHFFIQQNIVLLEILLLCKLISFPSYVM